MKVSFFLINKSLLEWMKSRDHAINISFNESLGEKCS